MAIRLPGTFAMRTGLAFAVTMCTALVCGQENLYHSQSRVVLIPVTATDKRGHFVEGLTARDFELFDDGAPRPIATLDTFSTGVAPIALVVAIQSAGISVPAVAKIRRAGGMMVPLISGARGVAAVMSFDSQIHLLQDFTSDTGTVDTAFRAVRPEGDTEAHMLDAALLAVRALATRPNSRRVLLVISETRDRGSQSKLADVMREAERADVSIYAASYSVSATTFVSKPEDVPPADNTNLLAVFTELGRMGKTNTVRALTTATGGIAQSFTRERALEHIVERIGTELHSRYILGYVPADVTPGFHPLAVRIRDRPDVSVRARPGYWATASESAGASPAAPGGSSHPRQE